jgi:hypothetical protein
LYGVNSNYLPPQLLLQEGPRVLDRRSTFKALASLAMKSLYEWWNFLRWVANP